MLDAIKKYFRRKAATPTTQQEGQGVEPVPLRIEGVKPAPLTPEPDDAELAAQALMESLVERPTPNPSLRGRGRDTSAADHSAAGHTTPLPRREGQGGGSAAYYHALADRIRTARTAEARLVMRLLATVEERLRVGEQSSGMQLAEPTALYKGQWDDTERKLYRAMDVAEREGGELHRRWQHCLANVLVRQMEEEREAMEDGRRKMEDGSGDVSNPANSEPSNPANSEPANPANSGAANPANSGAAGDNDNSSLKV